MIHTQKQMMKILCVMLIFASLYGCKDNQESVNSGTDSAAPVEANAVQYETMEVNGRYEDDYVVLNYIPEEFVLTEKNSNKTRTTLIFETENNYFAFAMRNFEATNTFDTQNAEIENLWINGKEAFFSSKENVNILIWSDDDKTFKLTGDISQEEMMKIAENTQKK